MQLGRQAHPSAFGGPVPAEEVSRRRRRAPFQLMWERRPLVLRCRPKRPSPLTGADVGNSAACRSDLS